MICGLRSSVTGTSSNASCKCDRSVTTSRRRAGYGRERRAPGWRTPAACVSTTRRTSSENPSWSRPLFLSWRTVSSKSRGSTIVMGDPSAGVLAEDEVQHLIHPLAPSCMVLEVRAQERWHHTVQAVAHLFGITVDRAGKAPPDLERRPGLAAPERPVNPKQHVRTLPSRRRHLLPTRPDIRRRPRCRPTSTT
jgi:hypothetical protein